MIKKYFTDLPKFLQIMFMLAYDRTSWLKIFVITIYLTVVLIYSYPSLYIAGLKESLKGPAFVSIVGTITIGHQFFFCFNQEKIKKLVNILKELEEMHLESWKNEISKEELKKGWGIIYKYSVGLIFYYIIYQFSPFVFDVIIGLIYPDFVSLRVPLFTQGYIDLTEPRSMLNTILSSVSLVWVTFEIISHAAALGLIIIPIYHLRVEQKIIQENLKLIKKMFDNERKREECKKLLNEVIHHHQMVMNGLDHLSEVIGFPIALNNTIASICFGINLYGILTLEVDDDSVGAKSQAMFGMSYLCLILFVECILGESMETENYKIYQGVYDLPWYEKNSGMKKSVVLMLQQTGKPFIINYHLLTSLNLETFAVIINTSYSYFMVLQSTT